MGRGFPYLLASQYLLAGVGAVLGVLTAAFTTTILREERVRPGSGRAGIKSATPMRPMGSVAGGGGVSSAGSHVTQSFALITCTELTNTDGLTTAEAGVSTLEAILDDQAPGWRERSPQ